MNNAKKKIAKNKLYRYFVLLVRVTLYFTINFTTTFSVIQYMISHAAATVIPTAHPITPPKWARMRKRKEVKIELVNN